MSDRAIEHIRLVREDGDGWVAAYAQALSETALGETSREVILADSQYIAERACLELGDPRWDSTRLRTGAVMGAVQSGKTASMLGVLAHALDAGVNVTVLLAGTRTALWRQTIDRFRAQLDSAPRPLRRRLLVPSDGGARTVPQSLDLRALYGVTDASAERALGRGRPIVFLAMKQVDHLRQVSQVLHETVYPAARRLGRDIRLLVMDDEADDSSIADEGSSADMSDNFSQVPRRIFDLWGTRRSQTDCVEGVFATYIAYTATPQANFLQDPQNPLAPRHFIASLRTPGPDGTVEHRSLTYRVPEGLVGWYTGADIYYRELEESLCVVTDGEEELAESPDRAEASLRPVEDFDAEVLRDAVRAYLVAAAVKLLRAPDKFGPGSAKAATFDTEEEARRQTSLPTSMLVHPSSSLDAHFRIAEHLQEWWDGEDGDSLGGVVGDLVQNEDRWLYWLDSFQDSAEQILRHFRTESPGSRPTPSWPAVRQKIVSEVVPGTRIAVINSDSNADDRPRFDVEQRDDGWHAPHDHSTIFVSGNVMSRGLTLEGLLTTVFTRSSRTPLADTQMQMQRWFGYRGEYIDLCRVFLSRAQLELFTQYGEADQLLRAQILAAMAEDADTLPDITVLQGLDYLATGKVPGLRSRSLSPGRRPFIRRVNPPEPEDRNLTLVSQFFLDAQERGHLLADRRGLLATEPLGLLEAADLVDAVRLEGHGAMDVETKRWRAVERQLGIDSMDPAYPLYRAPAVGGLVADLGRYSPHVIAAYLRLWTACLERSAPGLMTDEDPPQRWSLLNLSLKSETQPRFYVGLRLGSGEPVSEGPLAHLAARVGIEPKPMVRDFGDSGVALAATWGSRGRTAEGYAGDDLFDYQLLDRRPELNTDGTRLPGGPGLILFHLVVNPKRPTTRGSIAVGLSIPAGGPNYFAAVSRYQEQA